MNSVNTYLLKNLDCPHCAAKIEKAVGKISGVKSASVDFVAKRLVYETDDVPVIALKSVINEAVKKVEPDVELMQEEITGGLKKVAAEKPLVPKGLLLLASGALIFIFGMALSLFHANQILTTAVFVLCLIVSGGEVFIKAVKNIMRGRVFDENLLMSIATIAAFAIGQYEEGAAVMLFNQVGEYLQDLATEHSKKSITDLMDLRPDYAVLKLDEGTKRVAPQDVAVGQVIEVRPGERVPLDGVVLRGHSFVDTAALTGEPVPKEVLTGDSVSGGFINRDGLLEIRVEKPFAESTVSKIISLVQNAGSKKAKAENFITKFARFYTPAVTLSALLLAVVPPLLFHVPFGPWIYRAVVFLVISCPCALVVSVPLGFFAGIGTASANGVLVKGGNYLEKLGTVDTVVFDKTGTLTRGVFEVTKTITADGVDAQELLRTAAAAEGASNHPISRSIIRAAGKQNLPQPEDVREYPGMGIAVRCGGHNIAAGNKKLMKKICVAVKEQNVGGTSVYVARDDKYMGCIIIADVIKSDAKQAIAGLRKDGVKHIIMLTGDNERAAREVAQKLSIDDVCAGLLPDGKVEMFEKIASGGGTVAFVGDGVNDAPVLARADVGIAMGGIGSDAAIEAADVVVMDDEPSKLSGAVKISRYVKRIVWQNITFALAVKFAVLLLGFFGLVNIWAAVFADTGVALLAILNSMRTLINRKKFAQS